MARLGEQYEDIGSSYAAEGTEAHTLCEYKLKTALGIRTKDPTTSLTYYSEEMEECANGYAAYIIEPVETAKQNCADPVVLIEQRLDYSKYVEDYHPRLSRYFARQSAGCFFCRSSIF